ncbi:MAG: hypothetical protein Q7S22_00080, partial [Candidatus Micrarchaeota archaeon]|nr:hypothetical protein [Candidatus Micrarchaeota archaeon]
SGEPKCYKGTCFLNIGGTYSCNKADRGKLCSDKLSDKPIYSCGKVYLSSGVDYFCIESKS